MALDKVARELHERNPVRSVKSFRIDHSLMIGALPGMDISKGCHSRIRCCAMADQRLGGWLALETIAENEIHQAKKFIGFPSAACGVGAFSRN